MPVSQAILSQLLIMAQACHHSLSSPRPGRGEILLHFIKSHKMFERPAALTFPASCRERSRFSFSGGGRRITEGTGARRTSGMHQRPAQQGPVTQSRFSPRSGAQPLCSPEHLGSELIFLSPLSAFLPDLPAAAVHMGCLTFA